MTSFGESPGCSIIKPENRTIDESGLLPIGKIASRHLIAKTKETDIYAKSIEQIVSDAENIAELRTALEAVTEPYERLFAELAASNPKKQIEKEYVAGVGHAKKGSWRYRTPTPNGILDFRTSYLYDTSSKKSLKLIGAETNIYGHEEPRTSINIGFRNNQVNSVELSWSNDFWLAAPTVNRYPVTLMKNLDGTQLGEFINLVISPHSPEERTGKASLSFSLGDVPNISTKREIRWKDEKGSWVKQSSSVFVYDSAGNSFVRHQGLGNLSEADGIEALSNEEVANLLHELLELIPTVNFDRPIS